MRNKKGQYVKGKPRDPKQVAALEKANAGNQYAKKLTTPELMQEAYRQYCEHLSKGFSRRGFVFKHPEISLTSKTMDKYIAENPKEFPSQHIEAAEEEGYHQWEKEGLSMMRGEVKNSQPAIFQMFMRNKYGWDRESKVTHSFEPDVRTMLKKLEDDDSNKQ